MAIDNSALYNLGYGLYIITSNDGVKDNGMIGNTVMQVSNYKIAVGINKANYSYGVIEKTKKMNVLCLSESAKFERFKTFGFQSGKDVEKLRYETFFRSENGLAVIDKWVNAYLSLEVEQVLDLGSHGLFICSVTESGVFSKEPSMTYAYYHKHVKPQPKPQQEKLTPFSPTKKEATVKGYRCKICGYVHEGTPLPQDFVCPWCKHPATDFEPIDFFAQKD